jgi:hypothetical protein
MITVRVGRLPGRIVEIALNGERTVATALATAGLDPAGYEIRVQGVTATPATTLSEGDLVLLVKKIKGNGADGVTLVRVGRVPGPALTLVAIDTATVGAGLAAAGLAANDGEAVYINDRLAVSLDEVVTNGDAIVIKAVEELEGGDEPCPSLEEMAERKISAAMEMAARLAEARTAYRDAKRDLESLLAEIQSAS